MENKQGRYEARFLYKVDGFIKNLPESDRVKIASQVERMQFEAFSSLNVKMIKKALKELIIKNYRLIFFINKNCIYFIGAFVKKTQKTPRQEIINAEKIYKDIINNN